MVERYGHDRAVQSAARALVDKGGLIERGLFSRVSPPGSRPLRVVRAWRPNPLLNDDLGYLGPRSCAGSRRRAPRGRTERLSHLRDIALDTLWALSHRCALCGLEIQARFFADVDHVQPIAKTGEEVIRANLALMHGRCNQVKGDRDIADVRKAIADNPRFEGLVNRNAAVNAMLLYQRASFEIPAAYYPGGVG